MDLTVSLRAVVPEDRPLLLEIYGGTRAAELALVDWDEDQKREFIAMQFHAQDTYYRANCTDASYDVILVNGEPAGRLYTARWPTEIRVIDIALLAPYQGRGVGTRLLSELQGEAAAAGKRLSIHVEQFNPARRLYTRLGFKLVSEHGMYLLMEWWPEGYKPGD